MFIYYIISELIKYLLKFEKIMKNILFSFLCLFSLVFSQTRIIEPVLKVGGEDNDELIIGRVGSFIINDAGNIVYTEDSDHKVCEISQKGKLIREVGQKGKGPGDFGFPSFIDEYGSGYLIWENMNKRFQIIDKYFNFVKFVSPKVDVYYKPKAVRNKSELIYLTEGSDNDKKVGVFSDEFNQVKFIIPIEGKPFSGLDFNKIKSELCKGKIPQELINKGLLTINKDGSIIIASQSLRKIEKFDSEGNLVAKGLLDKKLYNKALEETINYNKKNKRPLTYAPLDLWFSITNDGKGGIYIVSQLEENLVYHYDNKLNLIEKITNPEIRFYKIHYNDGHLWAFDIENFAFYKFKI